MDNMLSILLYCTLILFIDVATLVTLTTILLNKITAAQNEVALSYLIVCGLYFMAVIFVATIQANEI